jgi:hypothetical protein
MAKYNIFINVLGVGWFVSRQTLDSDTLSNLSGHKIHQTANHQRTIMMTTMPKVEEMGIKVAVMTGGGIISGDVFFG